MRTAVRCDRCGVEVDDGAARWCGGCGARVGRDQPSRRSTTAPVVLPVGADDTGAPAHTAPPLSTRSRVVAAIVVALVIGGLAVAQASREIPPEPRGYTARGDAGRTGVVSLAELAPPQRRVWEAELTLPPATLSSGVVAADARSVLVVDPTTGLSLHDSASGELRWRRWLPQGTMASPPVLAPGAVVLSHHDGIVAYDRDTGHRVWRREDVLGTPVTVPDGLAGSVDDRLSLVDPATGATRWEVDVRDRLDASLRLVFPRGPEGLVVVLATRPPGLVLGSNPELETAHVVAFDARTGEVVHEIDLPRGLAWAQDPVAVSPEVVVAGQGPDVWMWDAASGAPLVQTGHRLGTLPQAVHAVGDLAVVLSGNGMLRAFGPDGSMHWSVFADTPAQLEVVRLGAGGDHLVVGSPGRSTVLEARTGRAVGGVPVGANARRGPATDAGLVHVLRPDGELVAYELAGGIAWRQPSPVAETSAPVTAEEQVYVSTATGLVVLAARDGALAWEHRTATADRAEAGDLHAPAVDADTGVVVVSPPRTAEPDLGGVFALDGDTGILAWSRLRDEPPPRGPLTFDRDTVFLPVGDEIHGHELATGRRSFAAAADTPRGPVASGGGYLVAVRDPSERPAVPTPERPEVVAIRRADRSTAWTSDLRACTPPTVVGDHVLFGTAEGVVALDLVTGERRWSVATELPACRPLAAARGIVVATVGDHELLAVNLAGGDVRWRVPAPTAVAASPSVADDTLLVPGLDGHVRGRDLQTGEMTWTVATGGVPASSPVIADGNVLVLLRDGRLVALAP